MKLPPLQITFRGVSMMLSGLFLIVLGGYVLLRVSQMLGIGLALFGIGTIALGATNGFNDPTPFGQVVYKAGMLAYIVAIPLIGYSVFKSI